MRKTVVGLLIIFTILAFCGCSTGVSDTDNPADEFITQLEKDYKYKKLSSEELLKIEDWFNEKPIRGRFLETTYDAPENIDMYSLFYLGNGEKREIEQDDIRSFLSQYGWWGNFEADIIDEQIINDVLLQYTGITFENSNKVHLDGLYYVDATESYYSIHGEAAEKHVSFDFGYRNGDIINLYYKNSFKVQTRMDGWFRVSLKENGNGYTFISNAYCDESGGEINYRYEVYEGSDENLAGESVTSVLVDASEEYSRDTPEDAINAILAADGFELVNLTGQSWTDVSDYGTLVAGKVADKLELYFVLNDGKVFHLPLEENKTENDVLVGGGGIILEYMFETKSEKEVCDVYYTLLLPTNEIFIRTLKININ